jgi:hypothetical protein
MGLILGFTLGYIERAHGCSDMQLSAGALATSHTNVFPHGNFQAKDRQQLFL